ncbi:peptidoglycan glycosyltransferase [Actinocorallia herbida]|uniref:Peptidoglycan glycosyltransferase n=2 Tax=Actinocorallia herbida TaxID=58109 RepID=A0A3N1CV16_9ACTN|nr:peptidoglycan glycosyltransferase [Actinocorallia herbida]
MGAGNMDGELKRVGVAGLALIGALALNVTWIQAGRSDDLRAHALNNRRFQGVALRARGDIVSADGVTMAWSEALSPGDAKTKYQRRYLENGEAFLPVTGYYAGTLEQSGLELAFDSVLDGTDQRQTAGSWVHLLTGEKPLGGSLRTTIDAKAQVRAYQAFASFSPTPSRAAAVFLELKTGAIKVAAHYPSFDPNTVADIKNPGDDQRRLEELDGAKGRPRVNKAFLELFPPGSSFKAVVAAAFLGKDGNTKDSVVPAPPTVATGGGQIKNSHDDHGCGVANGSPLIDTFAQSCNTTYALMGVRDELLGNEAIRAQSEKFGFYKPIPIEQDLSAPASEYPHDVDNRDEILRGSFGQGETKTTTLQMAMVAAAIANGGEMMKPYLVDKAVGRIEGDKGKPEETGTIHEAEQETFGKPISGDTASQLQDMMREVVSTGTAKALQGRNIAGKTGTTELTATRGGAWFVGFAPIQEPRYAFAVFVEGPSTLNGAGDAGPIAADIFATLDRK